MIFFSRILKKNRKVEMNQIQRKLVIVGNGGVGKTSFVKRVRTAEFEKKYVATLGVEVHPITVDVGQPHTVKFTVWDTAGQPKFRGLAEGYFIGAHCAIVMFSVCDKASFLAVGEHIKSIAGVCSNIPIVVVGNKVDSQQHREVSSTEIRSGLVDLGIPLANYVDLSVKTNFHLYSPFVKLAAVMQK